MILPVSAIFQGLLFPASEGLFKSDPGRGAVNPGDRKIAGTGTRSGRLRNAPGPAGFSRRLEARVRPGCEIDHRLRALTPRNHEETALEGPAAAAILARHFTGFARILRPRRETPARRDRTSETHRMNRTGILIANGALLVLCCFLAARILAAVAGEFLAPPPAEETALSQRVDPSPAGCQRPPGDPPPKPLQGLHTRRSTRRRPGGLRGDQPADPTARHGSPGRSRALLGRRGGPGDRRPPDRAAE